MNSSYKNILTPFANGASQWMAPILALGTPILLMLSTIELMCEIRFTGGQPRYSGLDGRSRTVASSPLASRTSCL